MQKTVTIIVCDVCGDEKKAATKYEITSNGKTVDKELCPTHAGPLEVLLGNRKRTGRPPAAKAAAKKVTSMAEVEALKKRPAKAAAKRA